MGARQHRLEIHNLTTKGMGKDSSTTETGDALILGGDRKPRERTACQGDGSAVHCPRKHRSSPTIFRHNHLLQDCTRHGLRTGHHLQLDLLNLASSAYLHHGGTNRPYYLTVQPSYTRGTLNVSVSIRTVRDPQISLILCSWGREQNTMASFKETITPV